MRDLEVIPQLPSCPTIINFIETQKNSSEIAEEKENLDA